MECKYASTISVRLSVEHPGPVYSRAYTFRIAELVSCTHQGTHPTCQIIWYPPGTLVWYLAHTRELNQPVHNRWTIRRVYCTHRALNQGLLHTLGRSPKQSLMGLLHTPGCSPYGNNWSSQSCYAWIRLVFQIPLKEIHTQLTHAQHKLTENLHINI